MRIYAGNLPYSVTDDELREKFAEYGEVADVLVVKDRISGQSKGFGFVDMPNDSEANQAIEALDDQPFTSHSDSSAKPRKLKVNKARPKANT